MLHITHILLLLLQHIEVVKTLSAALSLHIFVSFNANAMVLFHHKQVRIDTAIKQYIKVNKNTKITAFEKKYSIHY